MLDLNSGGLDGDQLCYIGNPGLVNFHFVVLNIITIYYQDLMLQKS